MPIQFKVWADLDAMFSCKERASVLFSCDSEKLRTPQELGLPAGVMDLIDCEKD